MAMNDPCDQQASTTTSPCRGDAIWIVEAVRDIIAQQHEQLFERLSVGLQLPLNGKSRRQQSSNISPVEHTDLHNNGRIATSTFGLNSGDTSSYMSNALSQSGSNVSENRRIPTELQNMPCMSQQMSFRSNAAIRCMQPSSTWPEEHTDLHEKARIVPGSAAPSLSHEHRVVSRRCDRCWSAPVPSSKDSYDVLSARSPCDTRNSQNRRTQSSMYEKARSAFSSKRTTSLVLRAANTAFSIDSDSSQNRAISDDMLRIAKQKDSMGSQKSTLKSLEVEIAKARVNEVLSAMSPRIAEGVVVPADRSSSSPYHVRKSVSGNHTPTLSDIRLHRASTVIDECGGLGNGDSGSLDGETRRPMIVAFLCLFGVLPWQQTTNSRACRTCSVLYTWWIVAMLAMSLSLSTAGLVWNLIISASSESMALHANVKLFADRTMYNLPLALGSLLGMISLRVDGSIEPLTVCLHHFTVYSRYKRVSVRFERDLLASLICLLGAMFVRLFGNMSKARVNYNSWSSSTTLLWTWIGLDAFLFAINGGVLLAMALCIIRVCRAGARLIESFSFDVHCHSNSADAAREWNVIQAIMRTACIRLEVCFVVLQTMVFSIVLLGGVSLVLNTHAHILDMIPSAIIAFGVARAFFCAGQLTDLCTRVPSLVNSLWFGIDTTFQQSRLVEYIIHSAAGFHVFEIPITCALVFKFVYVVVAITFTVATKTLL